jgi:hypothetical protein
VAVAPAGNAWPRGAKVPNVDDAPRDVAVHAEERTSGTTDRFAMGETG